MFVLMAKKKTVPAADGSVLLVLYNPFGMPASLGSMSILDRDIDTPQVVEKKIKVSKSAAA